MNIPYRITPRPIWESPTWTQTKNIFRTKSPQNLDFQLAPSENFSLVVRCRQTPPSGPVAALANKLVEIVPRYRPVHNLDRVAAALAV
jgi:hypothetical protein